MKQYEVQTRYTRNTGEVETNCDPLFAEALEEAIGMVKSRLPAVKKQYTNLDLTITGIEIYELVKVKSLSLSDLE